MKHRTRAVAPPVGALRQPARRLAARLFLVLAAAAAGAMSVHAQEIQGFAERPRPRVWTATPDATARFPAPSASRGNDESSGKRGELTTHAAGRARVGDVPAVAGSAPALSTAAPGRSLPETRTWALFGVGLLAVLMMARRQRQQHD